MRRILQIVARCSSFRILPLVEKRLTINENRIYRNIGSLIIVSKYFK